MGLMDYAERQFEKHEAKKIRRESEALMRERRRANFLETEGRIQGLRAEQLRRKTKARRQIAEYRKAKREARHGTFAGGLANVRSTSGLTIKRAIKRKIPRRMKKSMKGHRGKTKRRTKTFRITI